MTKTVYFGGGCFWNAERKFYNIRGVISTEVGFCSPTDKKFLSSVSDVEVVKVEYNPEIISYRELIDIFWTTHNPLNPSNTNRSNGERSVLFIEDDETKQVAEEELEKKSNFFTSIESFIKYRKAPDRDQKYYFKK